MDKLWHILKIENYSALKRNELSSHEQTQTKSKCILLSEGSPSEKATYAVTPTIWHSRKGKFGDSKKIRHFQGLEVGRNE